jgi:hypothetical protein
LVLKCFSGVSIDSEALRSFVLGIRSRYNSIQLLEVDRIFSSVIALPHVSWLYQLRNSELFIQMWRAAGRKVCFETVDKNQNGEFRGFIAMFENLLDVGGHNDSEVVEQDSVSDVPLEGEGARLRDQELKMRLDQLVENAVLTQEVVVSELIPIARSEWEKLAELTYEGTLTIARLDQTFGKLESDDIVRNELKLLSSCASAQRIFGFPPRREIFEKARNRLRDYSLLRQLCKWLPSLLSLHANVSADLCATPCELDAMRLAMIRDLASITNAVREESLAGISDRVGDVREIFSAFSNDHLDFLATLSTCPPLVQWLLAHKDTNEFNKLLQVVRPCTDEPRLISAIASLVNIRTILLDQMYISEKYVDFHAFVKAFENVDLGSKFSIVTERAAWHLQNVIGSFDALFDVFEKQTR